MDPCRPLLLLLLCGALLLTAIPLPVASYPSIFSFGDSKADTGNLQAAFPFESRSEFPPYGRTFFHRPSDRFCDGRLVIDFQAEAYGLPFLCPYLRGVGSDFRHGANFAHSSSAVLPNVASSQFYLQRQFEQFKKLKANYLEEHQNSSVTPANFFGKGLYVVSTGENDYRAGLRDMNLTFEQVKKQLVPRVVEDITTTLEGLYGEGARHFLVVGIAADGCIPLLLTLFPGKSGDYDSLGCLKPVNDYVKLHNDLLHKAVKRLRLAYPQAAIAFGDYYGINMEILSNFQAYGFKDRRRACCGIGGAYNYHPVVQCGLTGMVNGKNVTAVSCPDPSIYVNWDGIHLTEAFYSAVAKAFLSGKYIDGPITLPNQAPLRIPAFSQQRATDRRSFPVANS